MKDTLRESTLTAAGEKQEAGGDSSKVEQAASAEPGCNGDGVTVESTGTSSGSPVVQDRVCIAGAACLKVHFDNK